MNKRQSMSHCRSIGVDVSKHTLDITCLEDHGETRHIKIDNARKAIERWLSSIKGYSGLIICESTGWYHLLFAHLCFVAGLDIRVINPLLSSKHSKSAIRKVKTDSVDSRGLAVMGITEPDLPPRANNLDVMSIKARKMLGLLHSLEKQKQSMKARMVDYQACAEVLGYELGEAERRLCEEVKHLEQLKGALEQELRQLVQRIVGEEGSATQEVIASVPGFSRIAPLIALHFDPSAKSARSWVGFVGYDISIRQSGTLRGRGRVTKRGNPYIRKRLFQAAWGAYMHHPEVRAYYDHCRAQGRTYKEALLMVARKLLRITYTLVQRHETYDPRIAFPDYKMVT